MTKDVRPMTDEERQRSKEREEANKCVSCESPAASDFCDFCLNEE